MSVDLSILNEEDKFTSSRSTQHDRLETENDSPQFVHESPMKMELDKVEGEL